LFIRHQQGDARGHHARHECGRFRLAKISPPGKLVPKMRAALHAERAPRSQSAMARALLAARRRKKRPRDPQGVVDMNRKSAPLLLALTGALALTAMGCSNPSGDQQQNPPNAATAAAPPPAFTATQPETGGTAMQPAPGGSMGSGSPSFEDVAGSKGYITQDDAQRIPWLGQHFTQCDANGDGRITQQEYSQCRQGPGQGTMQQPPALPPQGASTSG
jgi:hypothetical protein